MNDDTQSPQNEQPFESALAAMFAQLSGDPQVSTARLATLCPNDQPAFDIIVSTMPDIGSTVDLYPDEHSDTPVEYTVTKIDGSRIMVERTEADRE